MTGIDELCFDENGLIPCVVQDNATGRVLTLAYMNAESLRISIEKKLCCFYSRKRKCLWLKGETSGNYQHIIRRASRARKARRSRLPSRDRIVL